MVRMASEDEARSYAQDAIQHPPERDDLRVAAVDPTGWRIAQRIPSMRQDWNHPSRHEAHDAGAVASSWRPSPQRGSNVADAR